jgi:hypothetical protein
MAVSLTVASSLVVAELNANTSYAATVTDPRFYNSQISDAVLAADADVVRAICNNPKHPRRQGFITTQSGVSHGAQLTAHAGPVEGVQFAITATTWTGTRPGSLAPREAIDFDNLNPRAKTLLPCRYFIDGDTIFHNKTGLLAGDASAVSVNVAYPAFTKTSACQSPDEMLLPVVHGALAILMNVEGEDSTSAQLYATLFAKEIEQIGAVGNEQ